MTEHVWFRKVFDSFLEYLLSIEFSIGTCEVPGMGSICFYTQSLPVCWAVAEEWAAKGLLYLMNLEFEVPVRCQTGSAWGTTEL